MSINISVTPLNSGTLTVGSTTQPSVTLSVAGGIGPPGLGNLMLAEGDGIDIATVGNVATISTNLTIPVNLADLNDVVAAAPSTGEVLTYNGTAWTAAADSTNLTGYATEAFVTSAVANLVDSSPAALDTLNELAAALGDDPNFSATITASLAGKANLSHAHTSADITDFATAAAANAPVQSVNNVTGSIVIANGTGLTLTESGSTLTLAAVAQGGDVDGGTFGAAGNVLTEGGDNLAAETGDTLTVEGGSITAGDSIQLLRSNVAGATPSSLLAGELAINTEDGLLYWERANGTIASADIDLTLATVATTGSYNDLANLPVLGTAAATDSTDYATAAQGTLADSAVQPGDLATVATTGSYSDLSGIPTEFTPSAHTHTSGDVTDFGTAAAANAPLQSLNTLTGTLTIAGSGGTTVTEAGSTITVASTAPPTVLADLSDVSTATPSTGQVLKWTGSAWAPQTDATNGTGGGGGGGYGSLLLFG